MILLHWRTVFRRVYHDDVIHVQGLSEKDVEMAYLHVERKRLLSSDPGSRPQ